YVRVGRWRRGALYMRGGAQAAAKRAAGERGSCGRPCGAGQWARRGEGRARCCWTCVPCGPLAVPRRAGCRACPPGHRPDTTRTSCVAVEVEWGGGAGAGWARAAAAGAGAAGLASAALCAAAFVRHRHTPVVKSASRELCALLLGCAAVCHCAAVGSALRPSAGTCALVRLAAPALGGVYACVVARTVRIARLVRAAERGVARPRLLSARAQLWAWAALSAPGAAAAAWSARAWPPAPRVAHPARARSVLACGGEHAQAQLAPLVPALLLLAACVVLAVRTRRLPHNFNETRFIGAAAYTTCVTWVAFFPLYVATEARALALCACVSLSAGGTVALSLGPRLWVCVCRPQRNTRDHFLTATSIRCHIGKYRATPAPRDRAVGAAPAGEPSRTPGERRETVSRASQTEAPAALELCAAAGACARVRRVPRGEDTADVLILLLPHVHAAHHHDDNF
ncbi:metabotropic glutamate receptor 2-like, partial [Pectinophora gossypiella]|uniref:metabotropic glutamate receptor 2-like n=1 Tax=Pectinophora gossypiella TaxID=13191 RepID=UPI00214E87CF